MSANWERQKLYTPNGSQTLSKMPNRFVDGVYPKLLEWGHEGHVWDDEGKEYIDMIAGLGCISVGYADSDINHEAILQLMKGVSFSLPTKLEADVAEKLTKLVPNTDQWKFFKTGSEACAAAVKAARAITGRNKVMTCGYHGWFDWYSILNERKAGIPEFNKELVSRGKYNDLESFSGLNNRDYACLIIEPTVFDEPQGNFLKELSFLCAMTGTLLIFDEVVTGGRYKKFVAQNHYRIVPDITVLSKGIANGFPLGAVGARQPVMRVFERDDFFISGTFGGECVSLSACLGTVSRLETSIDRMIENGVYLQKVFEFVFKEKAVCKGYPTRLTFDFPTTEHKALFMQEMCYAGVLIGYSNFVMASYTDKDCADIVSAFQRAHHVLMKNWDNPKLALQGSMPEAALRMR
jgi:glutamate-1-semialdehyde 2,1-aminomutase